MRIVSKEKVVWNDDAALFLSPEEYNGLDAFLRKGLNLRPSDRGLQRLHLLTPEGQVLILEVQIEGTPEAAEAEKRINGGPP